MIDWIEDRSEDSGSIGGIGHLIVLGESSKVALEEELGRAGRCPEQVVFETW